MNVLGNVITQNNLSVGGTLSINNITAAAQHSLQAVTNVGNVTSNTVQFSNAITSLTASSNIVATGNVSAGHDTNTTSFLGRAAVGYMGQDDQASFAHVDHNDPARYAIKQTAAGPTYINTPAAGHIRFTVNDGNVGAEKMRITSAGKVGVGVTSPDATLHVAGNAYVSSNLTVSGNVEVGTANLFVDTVNSRVGVGTTSPLVTLDTHGTMRSSAPYPRLDFYTTTNRSTNAWGNSTDNAGDYRIYSNGDASDGTKRSLNFDYGQNSTHTTRMAINANGNVGIGTVSPDEKLHVAGNVAITWNNAARIIMNYDDSYRQGHVLDAGNRMMTLFSTTNDSGGGIAFNTRIGLGTSDTDYGTERMRITGSGNVGINTTTPHRTFDVQAPARPSGMPFAIGGSWNNRANYVAKYHDPGVNKSSYTVDFLIGGSERPGWLRACAGGSQSGSGTLGANAIAEFIISPYGTNFYASRRFGDSAISVGSSGTHNGGRITVSHGHTSYPRLWFEIYHPYGVYW